MAGHQEIQTKVQNEIDLVCGREQFPSWTHRNRMPYTQAVINEIYRFKTISPLNLLRMTTNNTTVQGLHIEKNTVIIANIWAVHHDSLYWKSPDLFNPNRFLTDNRKNLIKYETLIPFSIGKKTISFKRFICILSTFFD
jgi:cytochrome P450